MQHTQKKAKKRSPIIPIVVLLAAVCFAGWFVNHWTNDSSRQTNSDSTLQGQQQSADNAESPAADAEDQGTDATDTDTPAEPEAPDDTVNPAAQNVVIPADAPSYAHLYPDLYSSALSEPIVASETKTAYLTFDDGPSNNTAPILDALKKANVNATFFVVASQIDDYKDVLKRMIDEGNTLAIHCNVHEYKSLYRSTEAYLADFNKAYTTIYEATGYRVQCFRFPGGSNNGSITGNKTYNAIIKEMTRRGFEYFDWNAYDGDAEAGCTSLTPKQLAQRALREIDESSRDDVVVLMHDTFGKETTAAAVPYILEGLSQKGIECKAIDSTTRPVHFWVNDNTPSDAPVESTAPSSDSSDSDATDDSASAGSGETA